MSLNLEATNTTLALFFPEWQSGQNRRIEAGAHLVRDWMPAKGIAYQEIAIEDDPQEAPPGRGVNGVSTIQSQAEQAARLISSSGNNRIFTIGGGCGVELVPVSWLNSLYGGDLAVLWFDAHADLNTPASSPSGNFHGMILRTLLGEGTPELAGIAYSQLKPEQVFLCGARDLDPPEKCYVTDNCINLFELETLQSEPAMLISAIENAGFQNIYVHIDLDVIDPHIIPSVCCPTPGGMTIDELLNCIQMLGQHFKVVGASILEFVDSAQASQCETIVSQLLKRLAIQIPLT
jgi:arginase